MTFSRPPLSLLDALAETPGAASVLSESLLRAAILRHLEALFNAVRLEPEASHVPAAIRVDDGDESPWSALRQVGVSTLNFGLPAWAGSSVSARRLRWLEETLAEAVRRFEPRLMPHPLVVNIRRESAARGAKAPGAVLRILIQGWMHQYPNARPLSIVAELDADSRRVQLRQQGLHS